MVPYRSFQRESHMRDICFFEVVQAWLSCGSRTGEAKAQVWIYQEIRKSIQIYVLETKDLQMKSQ